MGFSPRDVRSQVHLGLNGTAGIQQVCDLQQSQLGDANTCGVGEPRQSHIAFWQTASDGCNANQVFELPRAKRGSAAGSHTVSLSGLQGNHAGSGESQTGSPEKGFQQATLGVHGKSRAGYNQSLRITHSPASTRIWAVIPVPDLPPCTTLLTSDQTYVVILPAL